MKNNLFSCLLPMRHYSERVKGKNYRDFGGKPLFRHVLDQILKVKHIDEIFINTDSPVIKAHVLELKSEKIRILDRPPDMIDGQIPMNDIINLDIQHIKNEFIFQTHSTNPFLRKETIENAITKFLASEENDSLFSVSKRYSRFYTSTGSPINHDPNVLLRTQDLEPILEENSCIYLFTKSCFQENRNRIGKNPIWFPISDKESIDIDTEMDFSMAEQMYEKT
tara:strand:- start:1149 stop:1817 length:669 start_codon:yes stop_codon:yes gene_type:complete